MNDLDEIAQKVVMRRIKPVRHAGFVTGEEKIRRSGNSHLEGSGRVLLQERQFMRVELARLLQCCSRGAQRASFAAAAWSLPFEFDALRDESIDGLCHVRGPRSAAHLSAGKNINPNPPLLLQSLPDGVIFLRSQFPKRNLQ